MDLKSWLGAAKGKAGATSGKMTPAPMASAQMDGRSDEEDVAMNDGGGCGLGAPAAAAGGTLMIEGDDGQDVLQVDPSSSSPAPHHHPPAHKKRRLILTSSSGSIAAPTTTPYSSGDSRDSSATLPNSDGSTSIWHAARQPGHDEDATMADPMAVADVGGDGIVPNLPAGSTDALANDQAQRGQRPPRVQMRLDGRPVIQQEAQVQVAAPPVPVASLFGAPSMADSTATTSTRSPRASAARATASISSALKDEAAEIAAMKAAAAAAAKSKRQQERELQAHLKSQRKQQNKKQKKRRTVDELAAMTASGYGTGSEADPTDVDALPDHDHNHAGSSRKSQKVNGGKGLRQNKHRDGKGENDVVEIVEIADDGSSPIKPPVEPPRPRKTYESVMGKVAEGRAAHPFFGGATKKVVATEEGTKATEPLMAAEANLAAPGTQEEAVAAPEVASSQLQQPPQNAPKPRLKPTGTWSAFGLGAASAAKQKLRTGWGAGREPDEPRWPNKLEHAISTPIRANPPDYRRQRLRSEESPDAGDAHRFWRAIAPKPTPASSAAEASTPQPSIFPYIAAHPAFTRAQPPSAGSHELLIDRLQPCRAEEVLGNEREARYLVDWMKELAIAAPGAIAARKEVTRRVVKGRGRPTGNRAAAADDWIVDDEDPIEERTPEPNAASQEKEPAGDNYYPSFSRRLANSILLHGPSGSGKTAAVHAAANELNWEIFEVNPGMGRRTGAQLLELVGDVGKNHTLSGAEQKHSLRQSVILLEEVDILYEEDKGFWAGVVALVAESRRPVVMTCNDLDLIPFEDLALQTTLLFDRPPGYLAIPYLETVTEAPIVHLDTPSQVHLVDQHATPSTSRLVSGIDLRRVIMQLQVGVISPLSIQSPADDLDGMRRQLDLRSWSDAWVESANALIEVNEIDRFASSPDDEVEGRLLLKPRPPHNAYSSALPGNEVEMADYLCYRDTARHDAVTSAQSRYLADSLAFLDAVIPLDGHLLPNVCLFTDVIPAVLDMIRIDDRLEREDADALANGVNRATGRMVRATATSMHAPYIRQMAASDDMGEHGLEVARQLAVWT